MASTYLKLPLTGGGGGGAVDSFNGRTGVVVPVAGDYNAIKITNTPAGTIAATNVQAALNELDGDISGKLTAANNLSDLVSASTARTNLGLATVASSGSHLDLSNIGTNSHSVIDTHLANNNIHVPSMTAGSVAFHNGTILSQDNATFFWDSSNKRLGLGVGANENTVTINGITFGNTLSLHAEGISDLGNLSIHRHATAPILSANMQLIRSRGTEASETAVVSDDRIGGIFASGHNGTDYSDSSAIVFEVDGTVADNDMPGRIIFYTSPDGTETLTEALRISSTQAATFASGPAITGFTAGSVLFYSGSAIAQDNTKFFWDNANNTLALGQDANTNTFVVNTIASGQTILQAEDASVNLFGQVVGRSGTASNQGGQLSLYRSRGTTAAKTAVVTNDNLGRILFLGYDGTDFGRAARIDCIVTEATPGPGAMGSKLVFATSSAGAEAVTTALELASDKLATFSGKASFPQTGTVGVIDAATINVSGSVTVATSGTITPTALEVTTQYTNSGAGALSFLGGGFTFWNKTKYIETTGSTSNGSLYCLVHQPEIRATAAGMTQSGQLDILLQPSFTITGAGTNTVTTYVGIAAQCIANTGVTVTRRAGMEFQDNGGTATITNQVAYATAAFTKATNYAHIQLGSTSNIAGTFAINSQVAQPSLWSGGHRYARRTSAAVTITVTAADHMIVCSHTTNQTVNLPAASTVTNLYLIIKKSVSGGAVTVDASGAETIDGATTQALSNQYETMELFCDGTSWHLVHIGAP